MGGIVVETETVYDRSDALAAEQTHKVVVEREEEAGFAGVALTARTSAELVVDTAALMALGADDE